jgi:hypothetical protein
MPRGRVKSYIIRWANSSPAAAPVPSRDPPVAPALPPTTRPALQSVSPHKRRFNTAQDAAAAKRFPAKRQRPGPRPNERFGETRKLRQPPPSKRRIHSYTREQKLKVIDYIADRRTWVVDFRPHVAVREGLRIEGNHRPLTDAEVAERFNIPKSNINKWWSSRLAILQSSKGSRRVGRVVRPHRPPPPPPPPPPPLLGFPAPGSPARSPS